MTASRQVGKSASQLNRDTPRTRHFRDLHVWQKSMLLARNLYSATRSFPATEQFGLTSQMRRAAVSIASNIAEGHGRTTDRAFLVFLAQARGSAYELQTQIQLSADLGFMKAEDAAALLQQSEEAVRMLNGLMRSMKGSG